MHIELSRMNLLLLPTPKQPLLIFILTLYFGTNLVCATTAYKELPMVSGKLVGHDHEFLEGCPTCKSELLATEFANSETTDPRDLHQGDVGEEFIVATDAIHHSGGKVMVSVPGDKDLIQRGMTPMDLEKARDEADEIQENAQIRAMEAEKKKLELEEKIAKLLAHSMQHRKEKLENVQVRAMNEMRKSREILGGKTIGVTTFGDGYPFQYHLAEMLLGARNIRNRELKKILDAMKAAALADITGRMRAENGDAWATGGKLAKPFLEVDPEDRTWLYSVFPNKGSTFFVNGSEDSKMHRGSGFAHSEQMHGSFRLPVADTIPNFIAAAA